jgi:pimeloyl-ACP methyl ester carboxylesterase
MRYCMTRIFLHGLESSSKGTKASFLRTLFTDMLIPDFRGSLSERMASLKIILSGREDIIIVGSSFGGLMATLYAMGKPEAVDRLVLLAPALNFPEFSQYELKSLEMPTRIIIGRDDTVTPVKEVLPLARKIFTDLTCNEVDDDHMLAGTFRLFDWQDLLAW